jgi:hypothetical protein
MKKLLLIAVAISFLIVSSCQTKVDVEKEKQAIIAVLEKSSQAWLNRDFDDMSSTWLHDSFVARINVGRYGYSFSEGWNQQVTRYQTFFENNQDLSPNKEVFSNYRVKIYPSSAFAMYDMELRNENNDLLDERVYTAFMEKESGQWKIVCLTTLDKTSYDIVDQNLKTSETYHKLNPDDIDNLLTDDFIGRNEKSRFTWNKGNHLNFWTSNRGTARDSIYGQLAQGDWVATIFMRKMRWQGKDVESEGMHFKRFEDGKIAEIYEFGDSKQWE